MEGEETLRERKRRETRTRIASTAMRLFAERGFDQVSIADIAAAAGVAEKTVYNYFPAKAEMFFDEAGDVLGEVLAAIRYRAVGESVIDAIRHFIAGRTEWAEGRRPARPTARFRQLIADSPALQAQQRLMFGRFETALAEQLADETGTPRGSVEPFVAAVALVGAIRAAFEASPHGRTPGGNTATALNLLARGFASYGVRPQASGAHRGHIAARSARK